MGRGRAASLLEGEPGIGKTTLLHAIAHEAVVGGSGSSRVSPKTRRAVMKRGGER